MIRVETVQARNMGSVTSLELHTQEYPKSIEEMKEYCLSVVGSEKQAYLAYISTEAVGHALVVYDKKTQDCMIESIGVHLSFRKAGVGRAIVDKITEDANKRNYGIKIRVASYAVDDLQDPWCIEHWLWKLGFKAIGVGGECFRYGKTYDYYIFERLV
jgi:GNAT superfamily N-acetyltransferase